ncbi:hypothetical protein HanXRQr2_Chr17g0815771 [Helianthus annuus]|uniref:DUF4408 domain-containing protein n=1 Tax=Helianthus annuus TaxID=4232 RepID=A0A251RUX8_HELAN|nr:uncharacterized protein LOC110925823 [Helianthus annuus]KAF5756528.1 hypothetical protein HanXRQr2_Chr17g0815771 [Helianthus annuus]KAJ0430028.1 hypothetical protein HanHA300_Chr17g0664241 [Helianthus annuus]KAJ0814252.1 hypothetical protein HanPSC8_Chr17g0783441 [Helianthus annuus]KAJ0823722.1 hypothetical protein HanLR1_Chr00c0244g0731961 [Helianthus annuus]
MVASSSSNSRTLSLKVLLISAGVASIALTAVPLIFNFAVNDLPSIWSVIDSWMKPPYLYAIVNGIIITIIASTHFQPNHRHEHDDYNQSNYAPPPSELTKAATNLSFGVMEPPPVGYDDIIKPRVTVAYESKCTDLEVETVAVEIEDEFITTKSVWQPSVQVPPEVNLPVEQKRLVTSRFAHNRKPAKNVPEGARALRVLKAKKHETLDSTWKMITDGRRIPTTTTKQFRKSDTFVKLHHNHPSDESKTNTKMVRKSETFKDQNHHQQSGEKLKKYLSPSHEELNRRIEAFIKKFNEDMRLQRQESLKHYMEMINGGGANKT